jgi:ferric iron reductase protein FhuF
MTSAVLEPSTSARPVTLATGASPLQQTLERLHPISAYLDLRLGEQHEADTWYTPRALFARDSSCLEPLLEQAQSGFHTTTPNLIGSVLLQSYQWPLLGASLGAYLADRRVPDLSLDNVQFFLGETGAFRGIAFMKACFVALPDDPAAWHPDARVLASRDLLRSYLRAGIESHLAWVIERLCERLGCNHRALWLCAADRCAGAVSWLMQEQREQRPLGDIQDEVDSLVHVPGSPMANRKTGVCQRVIDDASYIFLERATCCYWYRTDGGDYCSTCPRLSKRERDERQLRYLVATHDEVTE